MCRFNPARAQKFHVYSMIEWIIYFDTWIKVKGKNKSYSVNVTGSVSHEAHVTKA